MQQTPIAFTVGFFPPQGGAQVQVAFQGSASYTGGDPAHAAAQVQHVILESTKKVLQEKLTGNQVAFPTLAVSLPHFLGEVVQDAAQPLSWQQIQVTNLTLSADVPQAAVQPAAGQVMSGADIAANVAGNFAENAIAQNMPRPVVRANVGGFNVDVGPGASQSVGEQVGDEIGSRVLHYIIMGGVVILIAGVCVVAMVVKLLF